MRDYQLILGAKRFLSDYFGFQITLLQIMGIKQDRNGDFCVIQFLVQAPALDAPPCYLAILRDDLNDWELKRLP